MNQTNPQLQALKQELGNCVSIGETQIEDIMTTYHKFQSEQTVPNAINLQTMIRAWITTRQRYDLLHKIYSHGWGQDDTRHE